MNPEQENLLLKASRKLASAKLSLQGGFPEDAASRAYYAMMYIAQAILANEGLENKTHRGVIAAFGENVVRTGKVPREFHRKLIDAEKLRIKADYGAANAVTNEEARQQVEYGEQFIKLSNQLIVKPHYQKLYEQYVRQVGKIANQTQVDYRIALNAFRDQLSYRDVGCILAQSPKAQELKIDLMKAKEYIKGILQQAQAELQLSQDLDTDLEL